MATDSTKPHIQNIRNAPKWVASITDVEWKGFNVSYRIESRTAVSTTEERCADPNPICATVMRSYWEFARTHRVYRTSYEEKTAERLPFPTMAVGAMNSISAGKDVACQRSQLQAWLDAVLAVEDENMHIALWRLLGYPTARQTYADTMLADLPIVDRITGFLDNPKDISALCCTSPVVWNNMRCNLDVAWKICLKRRWPGIHDALVANLENLDWRQVWRQILSGGEILMGVHERQLKRGFAMSCMPAWVSWDKHHKVFRAVYLSGLTMTPTEFIGSNSFHRLTKIRGDPYAAHPSDKPSAFTSGAPCAVQWKMLRNGPFGWWFGNINSVFQQNGQWFGDVRFTHIVEDSRWHQLILPLGVTKPVEAQSGGYTGGVILVTPEELELWNSFLPQRPMCLA